MIQGGVGLVASRAHVHVQEWTFVVGVGFLAAVPGTTPPVVVDRLSALVHEPDIDIESIVSLFPIAGDRAVDSFVVVVPKDSADVVDRTADGVPVSVVIRGEIAVDLFSVGGSRRFTDQGIRPWLLADFQSVLGIAIGSPTRSAMSLEALVGGETIGLGGAPGKALLWSLGGPGEGTVLAQPAASEDAVVRARAASEDTVIRPRVAPEDLVIRPRVAPEDTVLRPRVPDEDTVIGSRLPDEDTVIRPRAASEDTVIKPRPATDDTVILRPRHSRPVAPIAQAAPSAHVAPVTPGPSQPQGPPQPHELLPRYGFRIAGGEDRRLDAVYYLGRRPVQPRVPSTTPPRLLPVHSRTTAVSATHLEIRQEGDSVVVTDLGSTNGTLVNPPRGKKERLRAGQSVTVVPGTTVDIGDGNIIEILPANGR
jgi:hypothetical protein